MTVNSTHCFDSLGNMVTGWVEALDNKWYYFENEKNTREGAMIIGWKEIQGECYFFTTDGSLLISAITPDGYLVDFDGKRAK